MSVDMYVSLSQNQANGVSKMCQEQISVYKNLQKYIASFAMDNVLLSGKAYTSAKSYFLTVLLPLAKGGALLAEATEESAKGLPEEYISRVDSGDLKQSVLEEKIQQAEYLIMQAEQIQTDLFNIADLQSRNTQLSINTRLIEKYQSILRELRDKLDRLLEFNASSTALFSGIDALQQSINQGLAQASKSWNASTGMFTIPADLSWVKDINTYEALYGLAGKSQREYIQALQEQFGFDEATAKQIYKVKQGIDNKFPDLPQRKKDWLFLRVLGEISYSGFKWDETAGMLGKFFYTVNLTPGKLKVSTQSIEEILKGFGFSAQETNEFLYIIRIQNQFSSGETLSAQDLKDDDIKEYGRYKENAEKVYGKLTDEEFDILWNSNKERFGGRADFTHQSITSATNLYDNYMRLANVMGFNHEYTNELASWRGDATTGAEGDPKLGKDDYKADLDAVNITRMMENNDLSYQKAANKYYNDIKNGSYTRAEKFKNNVDFDYVKSEIIEDLAVKYEYTIGDQKYQSKYQPKKDSLYISAQRTLTEKEKMEYIKKTYPDAYNFIKALENNENELINYAGMEG